MPPGESLAKEEIERRPLEGDAAGVADGAVGGVLDRAVRFDVADGTVAAVLDGSVGLDMRDGAVAGVGDPLGVGGQTEAEAKQNCGKVSHQRRI